MKMLICVLATIVSFNASAGVLLGTCGNMVQFGGYCEAPNKGNTKIPLRYAVDVATTAEVNAVSAQLNSRVDSGLAELKAVVAKNNSDINHLKDMASSEIEIPAELLAKIKEEIKKEILEELKK